MTKSIIKRCEARGMRMTGQRRIIAQVIEDSDDHPDVEELFTRASARDAGISIATVYRTVKLFEDAGMPFLYYENIDGGHSAAANQKERAKRTALEFSYLYGRLFPQDAAADDGLQEVCNPDLPDAAQVWAQVQDNTEQWWDTLLQAAQ